MADGSNAAVAERTSGTHGDVDVAVWVGATMAMADTPIDGGYGFEHPIWDPAAAYKAWREQRWAKRRHDELRPSVERMAGTSTVNECVVAHFEHDESSDRPPVVQYCDHLALEAGRLSVMVEHFGGQAAVQEHVASLGLEQVDDQGSSPREVGCTGGIAV